ncbi:MAG: 16S rRNA methyltransferase [Thermoplasmata archaeon]|nr:16S rRNA methyltransferase [Thermoplasmata archaeon]
MLNLVLADAELELVPEKIMGHPAVRKNAEKRGKKPALTLLDSGLHGQALRGLSDGERRGRPDIVHFFLLLAQDSTANIEGHLRVWVHTRNDEVIHISPETRIPHNASRFFGLMESLFQNRVVPNKDKPLLRMEKMDLEGLLKKIDGKKICFHPDAPIVPLQPLFEEEKEKGDVTIVVGGFAEGDFLSPVSKMVDDTISIYLGLMKVWTVVSKILVNYENAAGLTGCGEGSA